MTKLLDIDFYQKKYTGDGIKVALIDTGVRKELLNENYHKVECCDKMYFDSLNNHGSFCALKILEIAPSAKIIDLNVIDVDGKISEENVINAIQRSVDMNVDIIHLSLGFSEYSNRLYESCYKAKKNNILVIAATSYNDNKIYPADFRCVIKVEFSENQENDIVAITEDVFSISKKKTLISEINKYGGHSIAAAYFTGICCLIIESRPLIEKSNIIKLIFEKTKKLVNIIEENISVEKINKKSIFAIVHSDDIKKYLQFKSLMKESIVGYFNYHQNQIFDFNDKVLNTYERVYLINPHQNQCNGNIKLIEDKEKIFIGKFDEYNGLSIILKKHHRTKRNKLAALQTPIVLISGYGYDCSKFDIQLFLSKYLKNNSISFQNITYNPLGYIFDMLVYKYPSKMIYPDILFSINQDIEELEEKKNTDIIVINVGGGIKNITKDNVHNFGGLVFSYLQSLDIDVMILCVNTIVSVDTIKQDLERIKNYGVTEVIIVISDKTYNLSTLSNPFGISAYLVDEKRKMEYYQHLKDEFKFHTVLLLEENVLVYNTICSVLS